MSEIYQFIFEHGSGNVSEDLAFTALLLVVLVQALFISVLARKVAELSSFAKAWEKSSQAGKLQKLEETLHVFRTEVLRALSTQAPRVQTSELSSSKLADNGNSERRIFQVNESASAQDLEDTADIVLEAETVRPEHEDKLSLVVPLTKTEERSPAVPSAPKKSIFAGLARTRSSLLERIKSVFTGGSALSDETLEELEAQLIGADLGVTLSQKLLEELKSQVQGGKILEQDELIRVLKGKVETLLVNGGQSPTRVEATGSKEKPLVIMMVGVNGAGKTTTSAKLAHQFLSEGHAPLLVAADTFRAAAVDQLKMWGERVGVPVVSGDENAKPQTVVFEGMQQAKILGSDVIIIDTAGRLHNKTNLMQELSGVKNAIARHVEGAPQEILLVVDGSSGQNAIAQAREFQLATGLTGVVVTKLDGTPKGGSVVAIKSELGIPVRYIGVGEGLEDLRPFNPVDFSEALFGVES